jgi:hypothetical protein
MKPFFFSSSREGCWMLDESVDTAAGASAASDSGSFDLDDFMGLAMM